MKVKFEVEKKTTGAFVCKLSLCSNADTEYVFHAPLGDDLKYALYKGLGIDLPALDVVLLEMPSEEVCAGDLDSGGSACSADAGEVCAK